MSTTPHQSQTGDPRAGLEFVITRELAPPRAPVFPAGTEARHPARRTGPLVVERIYQAPAALVWRAISTPEEMSRWSFEIQEFQPEAGGEFTFYGEKDGVKYEHLCRVTEVIPRKRLAYSWRYAGHPGDSLVTIDPLPEAVA